MKPSNPMFEPEAHEMNEEPRKRRYNHRRKPYPRQISMGDRIIEFSPLPHRELKDMSEEEIKAIEEREGVPVQRPAINSMIQSQVAAGLTTEAAGLKFKVYHAGAVDKVDVSGSLVHPRELDSACAQKTSVLPCESEPEHETETENATAPEPDTEMDPDSTPET